MGVVLCLTLHSYDSSLQVLPGADCRRRYRLPPAPRHVRGDHLWAEDGGGVFGDGDDDHPLQLPLPDDGPGEGGVVAVLGIARRAIAYGLLRQGAGGNGPAPAGDAAPISADGEIARRPKAPRPPGDLYP